MVRPFVPPGFEPPPGLVTDRFVLEPLGPQHTSPDHAAWMSSIEHIHATPGFDDDPTFTDPWPVPMSLEENRADLERHEQEFVERQAFAYTVLDPTTRDVVGCVYLDPPVDATHDVSVRSWVRASSAPLDRELWETVTDWLASEAWPFERPRYAPRV